jgi:TRAP-type C4-dicarboxylate transport system permease small subunit
VSNGPGGQQPRRRSPVARISEALGVTGGIVSIVLAVLVTVSVLGRWLRDEGVPGDFEFVQMGTAVSVFFFLIACQARRGNIVVDTFTGFLHERARNRLDALWDVVYGLVMAFLAYCLFLGATEAIRTHTSTMVLQLPQWPALMLSALLLAFLAIVCFWTAKRLWGAR